LLRVFAQAKIVMGLSSWTLSPNFSMFKHVFTLNPVPVAFMLKQLQTGIRVQISDSYFTDIEHYSKFYIVLIKGHGYPSTMATFSSTLPCFSNLPWNGQIFAK